MLGYWCVGVEQITVELVVVAVLRLRLAAVGLARWLAVFLGRLGAVVVRLVADAVWWWIVVRALLLRAVVAGAVVAGAVVAGAGSAGGGRGVAEYGCRGICVAELSAGDRLGTGGERHGHVGVCRVASVVAIDNGGLLHGGHVFAAANHACEREGQSGGESERGAAGSVRLRKKGSHRTYLKGGEMPLG